VSPWKWRPERAEGIWRYGSKGLQPLVAAAPWLTVMLLLLMFVLIGGTMTASNGVLFELPQGSLEEGEATKLVALIMPTDHETLVFFDDSRYQLGDAASMRSLSSHFAESIRRTGDRTLLTLADRRITGGDLMSFAAIAKQGGFDKVLFAEKRQERGE